MCYVITLAELYGDDYPEEDELLWQFMGTDEFNNRPFSITTIKTLVLIYKYNKGEILEKSKNIPQEQRDIIDFYKNNLDVLKDSVIIIDSSEELLIDGYHRLIAALLKRVETLRVIDISEDYEKD